MMEKRGSAPTSKIIDESAVKVDSGIQKCGSCGQMYLAARGSCPSCAKNKEVK